MNELSLFTGMGGGIYGSLILGWKTLAYVENNQYCQCVIAQRQKEGWFDKGEIYSDIREFNQKYATQYTGKVDVLTGGFPCQPFSLAGKRKGTSDERYLFDEIIKTIKIIQPRWCFFENVPGILSSSALIEIYSSLNKLGYKAKSPLVLGSADCGNIHRRERVWIYAANPELLRRERVLLNNEKASNETLPKKTTNTHYSQVSHGLLEKSNQSSRLRQKTTGGRATKIQRNQQFTSFQDIRDRSDIPESLFCGLANECPHRGERLIAIGNSQDPIVMATAWNLLHTNAMCE